MQTVNAKTTNFLSTRLLFNCLHTWLIKRCYLKIDQINRTLRDLLCVFSGDPALFEFGTP